MNVVVVGGGLAGLTAAWRLRQRGLDVRVLEASERVGGCIASVRQGPFLFEAGPNSMRGGSLALESLVQGLDLEAARVCSNPVERHAWIWRHGAQHPLPSSPPTLLRSKLLSTGGKLRILAEPFIPRWRRGTNASLGEFLAQRLGHEAVAALVDPFTSGVFAGDPALIGLDAFKLIEVAAEKGSLIGALATARPQSVGGDKRRTVRSTTMRDGLETLVHALADAIGRERISTSAVVTSLTRSAPFTLGLASGETVTADRVVLAIPPGPLARLLGEPEIAIPCASVATVSLAFHKADFTREPDGFGILAASDSPLGEVLGVIYSSSVFPGRAPEDHVVLTCVMGGVRFPETVRRGDDELVASVCAVVERLFGASGKRPALAPVASHVHRWIDGIPQSPPGFRERVKALRAALPAGLVLAGGGVDGPGLDPVVVSALTAADAVSS